MRSTAHPHRRRGYVLVMTLAVLVLAAAALTSTGRLAVQHASRARDAERELQRRAGVASCRAAILPQAERLLETQETRRKSPMIQHRAALRLGEFTFDLIIGDEQAKANVNALLDTAPPNVVANRLRQALTGTGLLGAVALRPVVQDERPTVTGPGQLFDGLDPEALLASRPGTASPAELLTCWGDGAINVRRASESSLRLRLSPPWTQLDVARLFEARRAMFDTTRAPVEASTSVSRAPRDPLARLLQTAQIRTGPSGLTLRSTCHSLWIVTRDGRRQWYDLAVEDASDERAGPRVITFTW